MSVTAAATPGLVPLAGEFYPGHTHSTPGV